jgi:plant G-box-binding factor
MDADASAAPSSAPSAPRFATAPQVLQNMAHTNALWTMQTMLNHRFVYGQTVPVVAVEGHGGSGAPSSGGAGGTRDALAEKTLRRKQSNRDSARRSRIRKQEQSVEMFVKLTELEREVNALREENQRLTKRLADYEGQRPRSKTKRSPP